MRALSGELRGQLERSVVTAREEAERTARAALETLGIERREAFPGISEEDRQLRVQLRARARQLGEGDLEAGIDPLVEEIAYEGWHRMLFARFLAENSLLMHPSGVAVTLEECAELAGEEGEPDAWMVAARYASAMLPSIFLQDDPSARVRFAPEGRNALERILNELPPAVFQADDALGWVYQFWQSKAKKAVNESGVKIGAKELPAVTQLFTEDYMVRFLLENSLGAWWAARHPESPLIKEWEYLRLLEDGTPAAGKFEGWPDRAADVTMMDPCCGSGHFLVATFEMLRQIRMEEEGFSQRDAGDAVLRDNVHGLEIDPRCTQIAAFALAIAAWKSGGYRDLPSINVACSGIPAKGQLEEWSRLAGRDVNLRMTLEQLYELFSEAPVLGSLINPRAPSNTGSLFAPDYAHVEGLLERAFREQDSDLGLIPLFQASAARVGRAAALLSGRYTLVATNVPFLARSKQSLVLQEFARLEFPDSTSDLATLFLERSCTFSAPGGTIAIVTPQNWRTLGSYRQLRRRTLRERTLNIVVNLGADAFITPMWDFKIGLSVMTSSYPADHHAFVGMDVSDASNTSEKARSLSESTCKLLRQTELLQSVDARIILAEVASGQLLSYYVDVHAGIQTNDYQRYVRFYWEVASRERMWERYLSAPRADSGDKGMTNVLLWCNGKGPLESEPGAVIRGVPAWGKQGVAVGVVGQLPCTLYCGDRYDQAVAALIPRQQENLAAVYAYVSSAEYRQAVRDIDQALKVTPATLTKVPFDLEHWQTVAEGAGGLPELYSTDPTQWLFKGEPVHSTDPLHVAVVRLLGHCWPDQQRGHLDVLADEDGIVPLVPVLNEQPAAERLRALLAAAFGDSWSTDKQDALLSQGGYGGKDLAAWLRDGFFSQHAKLFHNRPFIWHIWDGTRDGFSALVNYHRFNAATLERLTYTYLGAWIDRQRGDRDAGVPGAEGRLVAALNLQQKLNAIREGEPPYDIYVRWKPKHEQPIGWDPDLNDGVRLNIRPFVEAGVLRSKFTINWNKDRGTNPDGSERRNDLHLTLAEKRAARAEAEVA